MKVPFNALGDQYRRHREQLDAAVQRVLQSGYYIGGPEVESFERDFARFAGATHCVGVANGTDAIALALRAAGVRRGDEVIVPAVSAYPTTAAVLQAEAVPVFVDVRLEDGLIDPALVEEAITPRTSALVPVHLYGSPCAMSELLAIANKHSLALIEDCAQAHGASPVGNAGLLAAWSFYPTKNLGAYGDAGAITTGSAELADKLRRLRNYGQRNRYEHVEAGVNSRLDPLQAAILAVKLAWLPEENERRRQIAARYEAGLPRGCALQVTGLPSRHLFPIRVERRDSLQRALLERGVETLIHYPIPMPDQEATEPAWRKSCPNARALCASVLSLPIHPELSDSQVDYVLECLTVLLRGG